MLRRKPTKLGITIDDKDEIESLRQEQKDQRSLGIASTSVAAETVSDESASRSSATAIIHRFYKVTDVDPVARVRRAIGINKP